MATITDKKRAVKYLNRDFVSLKRDLIEHLRVYFPDTIQDFNSSNSALMMLELMAYVGDNLNFYLDKKFNESFTESASELKNLLLHAKQLGFKPFGKSAAIGVVDAYIKVPVENINGDFRPNMDYAGKIRRGAKLKAKNGKTFETLLDIDFSKVDINNSSFIAVADRDPTTKNPTTFALRVENVEVKAGETTTTTISVDSYKAFRKITLPEDDVLEVLEVTDSENNKWYEVDYLSQDTVFDGVLNTGNDAVDVPYVLKLRSVPFRFITNFDVATKKLSLTFGSGDAQTFDGDLVPNFGDLSLPLYGKDTFTDFSLDPQNFLRTRTLGLAPVNTTLTVKYRVGGGIDTNVGAGEIDTVANSNFDIGDSSLSTSTVRDVANSFSVLNPNPIQGGKDELSVEEMRQLIPAIFAAQRRTVTAQDFVARTLSMPSKFGSVFRANAKVSALNKNAVELIVLSRDSNGFVTVAPDDLKTNLKTYLSKFRLLTDAVEILDGEVIDIALNFNVLTNPDFNKSEVVANCIVALQEFFDIEKFSLNQPINMTDIYVLLASVAGVLSVIDISITNRVNSFEGRSYSSTPYNIKENTKNGVLYCKENAIFQVKYLSKDIQGQAR